MEVQVTHIFDYWIKSLKDKKIKGMILTRIRRMSLGQIGDFKSIRDYKGILEARIQYGAGYRLYFQKTGARIVILCGGVKSTQEKDIRKAHRISQEIQNDKNEDLHVGSDKLSSDARRCYPLFVIGIGRG